MYRTHSCTILLLVLHIYLLVPHTYASYIKALMYILWSWNKILQISAFLIWYQSHCSDLFLAVLSLLVLLHSQHRFRRHNSRRSLLPLNLRHLPVVVFGFRTYSHCHWGVLHCTNHCTCHHRHEYCSDYISAGITEIVLRRSTRQWKPRSHWRPHAPSRAAQSFFIKAHTPHAPHTLFSTVANFTRDVISATSTLAYVSIQSSVDVNIMSSCWHHPLTIHCVDFDHWLFSRVNFCIPGSPYAIFHVDFIFAVCFYILCL